LITLQRWRGVASHFNHATLFDTIVEYAMLTLICIAAGGISYFYVRCFGKLELDAGYAAAVRSGMSFLMISCLIGFAISFYGYHQVAEHLPPETIGGKGVAKFPHGVAIHALQIIPGVIWLMKRFHFRLQQRKFVVGCLTISFAFQIAFACYQTINGLSRVELDFGYVGIAQWRVSSFRFKPKTTLADADQQSALRLNLRSESHLLHLSCQGCVDENHFAGCLGA
jgi:hypothetical protein